MTDNESRMIKMLKARQFEAHTLRQSYRHKDLKRAIMWFKVAEFIAETIETIEAGV